MSPNEKTLTLRIDADLLERFEKSVAMRTISRSACIREAIEVWCDFEDDRNAEAGWNKGQRAKQDRKLQRELATMRAGGPLPSGLAKHFGPDGKLKGT